jgi:hypothetical protein
VVRSHPRPPPSRVADAGEGGGTQRPGYVRAMADLIEAERNRAFAEPEKAVIFFSAHGVPVRGPTPGSATRGQEEEGHNQRPEER